MIATGKKAPDFTIQSDTGEDVSLNNYRGQWVVLFFYPKADTPGCTVEACELRDAAPRFDGLNAVILGASADKVAKQAKFKAKYELPYALLADADHTLAEAYGVWGEKKFMGRKYMGINRTTLLIDPEGKIAHIFEKVSPAGHGAEVLAKLKELVG